MSRDPQREESPPLQGGEDVKERVAADTGATFAVVPQTPDVRLVAEQTDLPVVAQHVDAADPGRGMGRILPETLRQAGAGGVFLNHAENRDTLADIERKVSRCRKTGLEAIVCVDSLAMARAVAAFDPDAVVFEKPDDIATDRAITRTHPDLVQEFVALVARGTDRTRAVVGGGIRSGEDARRAFELGADATGAASAVSAAEDPETRLVEFGRAVASND